MAMSKEYRRVLDRSLPKLCEDLDVDPIIPSLIAEELFTDNDREELEAEHVRSKKVVKFVSILKRRSQRAFEVFVNCLKENEGSKHLAHHMEEVYRGITNQQPVSNQIHMQETH